MSRVTVKSTIRVPDFTGVIDAKLMHDVQGSVIDNQIKKLIQAGTSPVRGHNRFPGYKAAATKEKTGYPYNVRSEFPNKAIRPVNLFLSGDMLQEYVAYRANSIKSFFMGIRPNAPEDVRKRAEGNNYGTEHVPMRRFIPAPGETYKVSIVKALRDLFAEAVQRTLKRRGG